MYRSQSSGMQNTNRLNTLMNGVCNKGFSHLLMVGDFNFRNANWEDVSSTCDVTTKFIDTALDKFLCQHVDRPTRYRGDDTPSTIDLVFTNEEDMIESIDYHSALGLSDHLTLLINFNWKS